jgi:uncharacterized protein with von Willebrand factor type A (vWA) domain
VKRHEHSLLFDQAFRIFWRKRGLVEKLIAQMSPIAPGGAEPEKPKAGALRVSEALAPPAKAPEPPREEMELSARLTVSEREVLKRRDFAQMSVDEIAKAKRLIAEMHLPDDEVVTPPLQADPQRAAHRPRRTFRRSLRPGAQASNSPTAARRAARAARAPRRHLGHHGGVLAPVLHFLHAVAEKRRRVHSFVFATRLTNITRELATAIPRRASPARPQRVQDWEGRARASRKRCTTSIRLWSRRVLGQGACAALHRRPGAGGHAELTFEMDRPQALVPRLVWLNPLLRFDAFEARAGASVPCFRTSTTSARSTASPPWTSSAARCPPTGAGLPIRGAGCAKRRSAYVVGIVRRRRHLPGFFRTALRGGLRHRRGFFRRDPKRTGAFRCSPPTPTS